MKSSLDFFNSLVITLPYPLSLLVDEDDITSQLLSSLSGVTNTWMRLWFFHLDDVSTKSIAVRLTVVGGGLQVSIQEREDAGVAGLHCLQGDVGGPVLKSVQSCIGQRSVAQTQFQSRLH